MYPLSVVRCGLVGYTQIHGYGEGGGGMCMAQYAI